MQPGSFTYAWARIGAAGSAQGAVFEAVREAGGPVVYSPAATAGGAAASGIASVPATLAAAKAAAASGGWVDVTTTVGGVPLLVAVDPTPEPGDAYWLQIDFRDIEREQQFAACQAARERWEAAGLTRYRYLWHYRGDAGTYTYRVTMRDDVSRLTRMTGSAVLWQSIDVGPRLDVLFSTIDSQLSLGGRVVATYDPVYGYPRQVTLTSVGVPSGTITISAFATG